MVDVDVLERFGWVLALLGPIENQCYEVSGTAYDLSGVDAAHDLQEIKPS